jgi:hypothetical protein
MVGPTLIQPGEDYPKRGHPAPVGVATRAVAPAPTVLARIAKAAQSLAFGGLVAGAVGSLWLHLPLTSVDDLITNPSLRRWVFVGVVVHRGIDWLWRHLAAPFATQYLSRFRAGLQLRQLQRRHEAGLISVETLESRAARIVIDESKGTWP